jgi:hypothetical protein
MVFYGVWSTLFSKFTRRNSPCFCAVHTQAHTSLPLTRVVSSQSSCGAHLEPFREVERLVVESSTLTAGGQSSPTLALSRFVSASNQAADRPGECMGRILIIPVAPFACCVPLRCTRLTSPRSLPILLSGAAGLLLWPACCGDDNGQPAPSSPLLESGSLAH